LPACPPNDGGELGWLSGRELREASLQWRRLWELSTDMQVREDELIDGSKGSYRHAYCPAESMDQLIVGVAGGVERVRGEVGGKGGALDGEEGRRQPSHCAHCPTQPLRATTPESLARSSSEATSLPVYQSIRSSTLLYSPTLQGSSCLSCPLWNRPWSLRPVRSACSLLQPRCPLPLIRTCWTFGGGAVGHGFA
jgi:hypothetical protein